MIWDIWWCQLFLVLRSSHNTTGSTKQHCDECTPYQWGQISQHAGSFISTIVGLHVHWRPRQQSKQQQQQQHQFKWTGKTSWNSGYLDEVISTLFRFWSSITSAGGCVWNDVRRMDGWVNEWMDGWMDGLNLYFQPEHFRWSHLWIEGWLEQSLSISCCNKFLSLRSVMIWVSGWLCSVDAEINSDSSFHLFQPQNNSPAGQELTRLSYGNREFYLGDRVIQQINNYDKDVFNGDIGIIRQLDIEANEISVQYPQKQELVVYRKSEIDQLNPAWAITVIEHSIIDWLLFTHAIIHAIIHNTTPSRFTNLKAVNMRWWLCQCIFPTICCWVATCFTLGINFFSRWICTWLALPMIVHFLMDPILLCCYSLLWFIRLTRAKKLAIVLGSKRAISLALTKKESALENRNTNLATRIQSLAVQLSETPQAQAQAQQAQAQDDSPSSPSQQLQHFQQHIQQQQQSRHNHVEYRAGDLFSLNKIWF